MGKESGKRVAKSGKQKRMTAGQKCLVVIAVLLMVALIVTVAYKSLFVRPDPEKKNDAVQELVSSGGSSGESTVKEAIDYGDGVRPKAEGTRKSEDYYSILILGRDTGGGGNTDTILLASYDVTNQKATVMSIPRDTMVNVSWDVKKINSVYNWYGGGDKGIQHLYKEISQLVGFEPDYQVVVEWEAVGQIVDAIGGVYFDVPYNMDYHDPQQDLVIEQKKGYRLLTGDDAMQVIRWRQNDTYSPYGAISIGDSGRIELQQDFLKAMLEQLMKPANVMNIGKLAKVFQDCVETDLSFQEILWFGKSAVSGGLSASNVEFLTMPWKGVSAWSRSYNQKLSYVVPIASELLEVVNDKLSPFADRFEKSDLDIMYVNSDGSIGSTSGYVEDSKATRPPVITTDTNTNTNTEDETDEENSGSTDTPPEHELPEIPDMNEPSEVPGTDEPPEIPGTIVVDPNQPEPPEGGSTGTEPPTEPPAEPEPGIDPNVTPAPEPGTEPEAPVVEEPAFSIPETETPEETPPASSEPAPSDQEFTVIE